MNASIVSSSACEEVHDLVAQVGDVAVPPIAGRGGVRADRDGSATDLGCGHRAVGHDVEARVEQQLEAAPAGVDHPGVAQHRQEVGRAGDRVARRGRGPLEHVDEGGLARRGRLLDRLGRERAPR